MTTSKELKAAAAVLMGRYGNGSERMEKLRKDGLDPTVVQNIVNQLIDGSYMQEAEEINTDEFLQLDVDLSSVKGIILCLSQ